MVRQRIIGLLANTAALSPEELNDCASLVEEDPEVFVRSVAGLHGELGLKILGGCCGTDDRHIHCLATRLTEVSSQGRKNPSMTWAPPSRGGSIREKTACREATAISFNL